MTNYLRVSLWCVLLTGLFGWISCETLIPPSSCAVSREDFEAKVLGQSWIGIYDIDEDTINAGVIQKGKFVWTAKDNATIHRVALAFNRTKEDAANGACLVARGDFRWANPNVAIFTGVPGDLFYTETRREWFLSHDPERYAIWFICRDYRGPRTCQISQSFIMMKDARPDTDGDGLPDGEITGLDCFPWSTVEKTLKCIGKTFDDLPCSTRWAWTGEECQLPKGKGKGKQ